jgi:uncharacterized phage-associated protein
MERNMECIPIDVEQVSEAVVRLKEYFADEHGREIPTAVLAASVNEWLVRHFDAVTDDLFETLATPRNDAAHQFRRMIDKAVGDEVAFELPHLQTAEADVFSGHRPFSFEKLAAMTAYIASRGRDIYKTKLNKLLFYSDFVHFYDHGTSISGARYVHLPFGPVPDRYEGLLAKLSATGMIRVEKGQGHELIKASSEPVTDVLTNEERGSLDWVLDTYGALSASAISERSHREMAYKYTRPGEAIAYEYAKFFEKLPEQGSDQ